MITWENYEEYIMMYADGELQPAEIEALMAFVEQHPELKKELEQYGQVRLVPDADIVFVDKASLQRPSPSKRMAFPLWTRYSVAAAVLLLIATALFRFMNPGTQVSEIAKVDTAKQVPVPVTNDRAPQVAEAKENTAIAQDSAIAATPVIRNNNTRAVVIHKSVKEQMKKEGEMPMPVLRQAMEPIEELTMAVVKEMPSAKAAPVEPEIREVPAYTLAADEEETGKSTFLDRLPIDDLKRNQVKNIAGAVSDAYNEVRAAREDLYRKSISIRVEKKRLLISF